MMNPSDADISSLHTTLSFTLSHTHYSTVLLKIQICRCISHVRGGGKGSLRDHESGNLMCRYKDRPSVLDATLLGTISYCGDTKLDWRQANISWYLRSGCRNRGSTLMLFELQFVIRRCRHINEDRDMSITD